MEARERQNTAKDTQRSHLGAGKHAKAALSGQGSFMATRVGRVNKAADLARTGPQAWRGSRPCVETLTPFRLDRVWVSGLMSRRRKTRRPNPPSPLNAVSVFQRSFGNFDS